MGICFSEPTIDELLDDSLTQGLMRADGVDVGALKAMLMGLASSIELRPAIQHDRVAPAGGVLARIGPASLQHSPSQKVSMPATSPQAPNLCSAS
jgi:hypothetical protein